MTVGVTGTPQNWVSQDADVSGSFGVLIKPTFTNIHVDIMASSGETSIKTILGPISGDISLVPSCMKM